jgi:hypothetical protein
LLSGLCQIIGDELFFTWHTFLEVGKTQDLPSKIWQTLGDARKLIPSPSTKWEWEDHCVPIRLVSMGVL